MIKTLKGLLTVAGKRELRFYLNGIHVVHDDRGVRLEASDGHCGIILNIASGMFNVEPGTDVILCRNSLDHALKAFGPKATPTFSISNESARIGEYNVNLIDGRYPDIARAMRLHHDTSTSKCSEIGLNFEILGQMSKACSLILHAETFKVGKFNLIGASDPLIITRKFNDDKDTLHAVIMPTRL